MNKLDTIDFRSVVSRSIQAVFETMLSMELEPFEVKRGLSINGERIVGSVSFAGDVTGAVNICVSAAFARLLTAAMLGMELEEIQGQEEINDVVGELSNMIGGDLKSHLCDSGLPCELSIPCVTNGADFQIESMGYMRHEKLSFRHKEHPALVEIFIKSGSNE